MDEDYKKETLNNFLRYGKIKDYPSKRKNRVIIFEYLTTFFEKGKEYSEKETNEILEKNISFGDVAFWRRELIDNGLLARDKSGSKYWKV